jgi:hypothetical protein
MEHFTVELEILLYRKNNGTFLANVTGYSKH